MDFLIKIDLRHLDSFQSESILPDQEGLKTVVANRLYLIGDKNFLPVMQFGSGEKDVWLIGDPLTGDAGEYKVKSFLGKDDYAGLLKSMGGHYRMLVIDRVRKKIFAGSSLFGVLPMFLYEQDGYTILGSNPMLVAKEAGLEQFNKKFILENILFYYPLGNETLFYGIRGLPSNSLAEISVKGIHFFKYFEFSEWYQEKPLKWQGSIDDLCELFLDRTRAYLPESNYMQSVTAGFDSRSLMAAGMFFKRHFETYSFGNQFSEDIVIGRELSDLAGIGFNGISLDEEYIQKASLENGLSFIRGAGGAAGFARAHYLYACKKIAVKCRYLVSGNFGSEIFRAAHLAGAVISPNLYHLFGSPTLKEAFLKIQQSPEFKWLERDMFKREWSELKEDLSQSVHFNNPDRSLPLNTRFYTFVFEEVFRKYFGAEMTNQSHYLTNRTPFLDAVFLKALFKTELAGVYNDFFTNNPLKRFKGQVFYAHLIKRTFPLFLKIQTDKGYRPGDLLSSGGKVRIAAHYLSKKLFPGRSGGEEPNSVTRAFLYNQSYFKPTADNSGWFDPDQINRAFEQKNTNHDFLIAMSQYWLVNNPEFTREYSPGLRRMKAVH